MQYVIEEGRYGPRLVLIGEWDDRIVQILTDLGIRELMLNYARGWTGNELDFLPALDFLEGVVVIHRTLKNDSAVQSLPRLRHLQLSTYCRNGIDFSQLPILEDCAFRWRKHTEYLLESTRLSRLYLDDYPGKDLQAFTALSALTSLTLSGGKLVTTDGVERLAGLGKLGLFYLRHLNSLAGLGRVSQLRVFEVEKCPAIGEISELATLHHCVRVRLDECGAIESLNPLKGDTELAQLFFVGSTNVLDGDLTALLELPRLVDVSFKNRRHYSHTREQLQEYLRHRTGA